MSDILESHRPSQSSGNESLPPCLLHLLHSQMERFEAKVSSLQRCLRCLVLPNKDDGLDRAGL
ncbi:hypothetical protein ACSBR2_039702 [Camellia fascicularis]